MVSTGCIRYKSDSWLCLCPRPLFLENVVELDTGLWCNTVQTITLSCIIQSRRCKREKVLLCIVIEEVGHCGD